jgi:uncharacterized repeat protein (TIGR03837 family)
MPHTTALPALRWDIFCRVIDNFGDVGVCWRLTRQLAGLGHSVRLWLDDASALAWMAPGTLLAEPQHDPARPIGHAPGIEVYRWPSDADTQTLAALPPSHIWVEAFGGNLPTSFIQAQRPPAGTPNPAWINLEYLSAESYVERSHRLPSPVMHGPAAGLTRHFFYPGFTERTGGLLRESDLDAAQAAFDAPTWLAAQGVPPLAGARHISLFCYEPPTLAAWLAQLAADAQPTQLLVTTGRASRAVQAALAELRQPASGWGALHLHTLPLLSQPDYDRLLWACDLNMVRGEDSLVRALWAGQPLVWHIYPQDDGAHITKLQAFLTQLAAPATLQNFHRQWNGAPSTTPSAPSLVDLPNWRTWARQTRATLLAQGDLVTQLLKFAAKQR